MEMGMQNFRKMEFTPSPSTIRNLRVIMNWEYLSSKGFISIRVGLTIHGSSFKNRHLVAKDSLKLNITIRLNIILYYS